MCCCDGLRRRMATAARTIGGGASGLTKAALDLEPTSRAVVAGRVRQCFGVPHEVAPCDRLGMGLVCRECGCLAMAKIRVASQSCPLGKWGFVATKRQMPRDEVWEPRATVRPPDV
jgi:hypothetical protein